MNRCPVDSWGIVAEGMDHFSTEVRARVEKGKVAHTVRQNGDLGTAYVLREVLRVGCSGTDVVSGARDDLDRDADRRKVLRRKRLAQRRGDREDRSNAR